MNVRFSIFFKKVFSAFSFRSPQKLKLLVLCLLLSPCPFIDQKHFPFANILSQIYLDDASFTSKDFQLYPLGVISDYPKNSIHVINVNASCQILIVNWNDKIFAIHGNCPIDGSRLCPDLLIGGKVFCLKHGSAFSAINGTLEYGPDLEDLRIYEIVEEKEALFLKIPNKLTPEEGKVINYKKVFGKPSFVRVVLIGNDPGVISCIQTLRMAGFLGEIDLILSTNNNMKPYDLDYSKLEINLLRDQNFFEKMKVNIINEKVISIYPDHNVVVTETSGKMKKTLSYNYLVLASRSMQKKPSKNGSYMENIEQLKNKPEIPIEIDQNAEIVIAGSSPNAFNLASSLKESKKEIILITSKKKIGEIFGEEIAQNCLINLKSSGIKVLQESKIKEIRKEQEIYRIFLQDGSALSVNSLIFQNKTKPNIELANKFLKTDETSGIAVDISLRTSISNIFALGSIIAYPLADLGTRVRLENNRSESINQGAYVALNILNSQLSYNMMPFESINFGKYTYKFIGFYQYYDCYYVDGDLQKNEFLVFYIKENNLVGACSCGRDKDLLILYEALRHDCLPLGEEFSSGSIEFEKIKDVLNGRGGRIRSQKYESILKNLEKVQFKAM